MNRILRVFGKVIYLALWPAWVVYFKIYPTRSRVFVVYNNQLLLIRHWLGSDKLGLPGGGAKKNEAVLMSAVRELEEETGITANPEDLEYLGEFLHDKLGHKFTAHFFVLRLVNKPKLKLQKLEIIDANWFNSDRIKEQNLTIDAEFGINEHSGKIFV